MSEKMSLLEAAVLVEDVTAPFLSESVRDAARILIEHARKGENARGAEYEAGYRAGLNEAANASGAANEPPADLNAVAAAIENTPRLGGANLATVTRPWARAIREHRCGAADSTVRDATWIGNGVLARWAGDLARTSDDMDDDWRDRVEKVQREIEAVLPPPPPVRVGEVIPGDRARALGVGAVVWPQHAERPMAVTHAAEGWSYPGVSAGGGEYLVLRLPDEQDGADR